MPVYSYKCNCGKEFDRFLPLKDYLQEQLCICGSVAKKILKPTFVSGDFKGYSCPVTGKWIEGRKAHEENLKRQGCRVLEPGEQEAQTRRLQKEEAEFEKRLDETIEREFDALPVVKKEQLTNEILSGTSLEVTRL